MPQRFLHALGGGMVEGGGGLGGRIWEGMGHGFMWLWLSPGTRKYEIFGAAAQRRARSVEKCIQDLYFSTQQFSD